MLNVFNVVVLQCDKVERSEMLVEINKIAIDQGLEDLEKIRKDTTTIETDIHHPTNNSLIWSCIRKSNGHLNKLSDQVYGPIVTTLKEQKRPTLR